MKNGNKKNSSPKTLSWVLMFGAREKLVQTENLLYMVSGVLVSVCINLMTTVFTTRFEGMESILFVISTFASGYATIWFVILTLRVAGIQKEVESVHPNSSRPAKMREMYDRYHTHLRKYLCHIFISSVVFLVTLIVGYFILNGWLIPDIINTEIQTTESLIPSISP